MNKTIIDPMRLPVAFTGSHGNYFIGRRIMNEPVGISYWWREIFSRDRPQISGKEGHFGTLVGSRRVLLPVRIQYFIKIERNISLKKFLTKVPLFGTILLSGFSF